jgi:hypothetical protein
VTSCFKNDANEDDEHDEYDKEKQACIWPPKVSPSQPGARRAPHPGHVHSDD